MIQTLGKVDIPPFKWHSGKGADSALVERQLGQMVFVRTDRISAFDVALQDLIFGKGRVLNRLSIFWKRFLVNIIPHDIVSEDSRSYLAYLGLNPTSEWAQLLEGRTILARQAEVVPIECVVRGYIAGSLYQEYQRLRGLAHPVDGVLVYGHKLPDGLQESQELPEIIFTPTTKEVNGHDQPLNSKSELANCLSVWLSQNPSIRKAISKENPAEYLAQLLEEYSLALYARAREYALKRGIIIADTKFEFGFIEGELHLIDEVLTPDSSRFWNLAQYQPGMPQFSFDKQPVRDYLLGTGWDRQPPAPNLPDEVVSATSARYREVCERLVGFPLK